MRPDDARELCRSLLEVELPRRWEHSQGVARQARAIGAALGDDAGQVEAGAWLHDIGYAEPLVVTSFHPLDGARYLRDQDLGDRPLWTLVAHHSNARTEARQRGLEDTLMEEFPIGGVQPLLLAAVTYCDLTTSPDGRPVTIEQRITEILSRYPATHVVHRSIAQDAPRLQAQMAELTAILGRSAADDGPSSESPQPHER